MPSTNDNAPVTTPRHTVDVFGQPVPGVADPPRQFGDGGSAGCRPGACALAQAREVRVQPSQHGPSGVGEPQRRVRPQAVQDPGRVEAQQCSRRPLRFARCPAPVDRRGTGRGHRASPVRPERVLAVAQPVADVQGGRRGDAGLGRDRADRRLRPFLEQPGGPHAAGGAVHRSGPTVESVRGAVHRFRPAFGRSGAVRAFEADQVHRPGGHCPTQRPSFRHTQPG